MASITIRNLSEESKERLRQRAQSAGLSLEALARTILDQAANASEMKSRFPHDIMALVEPGEDIQAFIAEHDQPQRAVDL